MSGPMRPALTLVLVFMCVLLCVEFRRRPKQPGGPRLLRWKGSHDALLLHPAIAVVVAYQGNAKRARKPDMARGKKQGGAAADRSRLPSPPNETPPTARRSSLG